MYVCLCVSVSGLAAAGCFGAPCGVYLTDIDVLARGSLCVSASCLCVSPCRDASPDDVNDVTYHKHRAHALSPLTLHFLHSTPGSLDG